MAATRSVFVAVPSLDIALFSGSNNQHGCSDPGIIVDRKTGELFCFAVWMNGKPRKHQWKDDGSESGFEIGKSAQFLMVRSQDDGLTWSRPENANEYSQDNNMSGLRYALQCSAMALCIVPPAFAAESAAVTKFLPIEQSGELVLFDAAAHDFSVIRNYTASWKKDSDLTPVVKSVVKDGQRFVEFTYRGSRGAACSTFWYEPVPRAATKSRSAGLKFTIDYEGNDFAKVSVNAQFTDGTGITAPLTLEPGCHDYVFRKGFRRAKHPPQWGLLSYFWLSATASGNGNPLMFRLKRVVMLQEPAKRQTPTSEATDLFGKRLFNPRLKHVRWGEGEFPARQHARLYVDYDAPERTRRTARVFAEKYYAHTGVTLDTLPATEEPPADGILLRVANAARHAGRQVEPRKEGYCLRVEADRVAITGFDEPGLFYGLVTFFQLMNNSMKIREKMPVPCVDIYDWPDLPFRLVSAQGTGAFKNQTPRDDRGIEYLMEWTDRFVAGQKANILFLDISSRVKYERRPEFNGSERTYSLTDLERFGEFCRDRFVEVCPAWQVGGHANWWLLGYHPELREKGYRNQSDVTHPEHNRIVFDCMLDVIEALDCKYVSPKSDEWWGPCKDGETPDELLRGKTRAEAFLDFHVELNDWLKPKGVTMLMYHDMLVPYHNGKKFDLYKIADRFPNDVIINYWGGYDIDKGIRFLAERGFPIWIHSTGSFIRLGEEEKKIVSGAGKILYSFGNDKTGGLLEEYSDFNNMYASFRLLDYAWNLYDYTEPEPGRLTTIKNIMAITPNPYAGERVEPIEMSGVLTRSFNEFLKDVKPDDYDATDEPVVISPGVREIGNIPMQMEPTGKHNCIALGKGDREVSVPIDGKCASLVFLHTAFINDPQDHGARPVMGRYWLYGWPCGEYVIYYEDGETAVLPVRLTMNIRRFDTDSRNRATNNNRYVYTVKDANQGDVHLFQWEWVNPKPDKRILKVVARHDTELDVTLILLAVSGRSVWQN